jgi:ligand-binding sensor domain-containing protein/signal transduction histidine kinase
MAACPLLAQDLIFTKVPLDKDSGLDSGLGLIAGIAQDQQGFLWLATHSGLYRYDGYTLTTFTNKQFDANTLADNRLESITADRNGTIWLGFWAAGLDNFDPRTGKFTHYRHNPLDPKSLSDDLVTALLQDRNGNLWVGTHKGLNLLNPETGTFTRYQHDPGNPASLSDNKVRAIYEDRNGTIWVGTGSPWESKPEEGGLNRFDPGTNTFVRYKHNPGDEKSLSSNWIRAIYEDSHNNFWIGTHGDGLHRMDRQKGTFERFPYDVQHPEKLSRPYVDKAKQNDGVNIILEDAAGSLWIGTYDSGLNQFNTKTGKVTPYQKSTADTTGLDDNNIWAAHTTREGMLWFGTANGNLYRVDPQRHRVSHMTTNSDVYSFYEDEAGFLLIGTSKGLLHKDLRTGKVKHFVHRPNDPRSLSTDTVYAIYKDSTGDFWLGGASGDLNKYHVLTGTFTRYQHDKANEASLSAGPIYAMLEDRQGNFWIATGFGLDKMDREHGTFTHNRHDPNDPGSISHNGVVSIFEDETNYLWLGTRFGGGVNKFNPTNGRTKKYLLGTNVVRIIKDAWNVIWVATESSGVYRYDRKSDSFVSLGSLLNEDISHIKSMVEDDQQKLWFSTKHGLMNLDKERDNISLLAESYGVKPGSFNFPAGYKGRDGKLYFGSQSGYYTFSPQQWQPNPTPPQIVFSGLRLFDDPVQPGSGPLKAPLNEIRMLQFGPDEDVFTFTFTGIHFNNPEQNRFYFKLENYDHDWRRATDRTASYYNVPPGNYVFRVKIANSDNVWAERSLAVRVNPHWWNTWWAYIGYGLLLVGVVLNFNRLQRRRLIKRERYRARERELAQAREIEKAYHQLKRTQAKLIQSEKMASLGELTAGIAHEIQNPLNFVNNFSEVSEELVQELEQEANAGNKEHVLAITADLKQNLQKIHQHGKRADSIVKSMLQHSRPTSGGKEPTDLNALADEYLRLSYHGQRAKFKGFQVTLETHFDPGMERVETVPQELGRVLLNLFNNAFYAVRQKQELLGSGYEAKVEVSTCRRNGQVEIKVKDNGTGMPEAVRKKVFQPFFTTKPSGQGTGLGLSLSYDIITKGHGGELLVESEEGNYTVFTILLPVAVPEPSNPPVTLTSNS